MAPTVPIVEEMESTSGSSADESDDSDSESHEDEEEDVDDESEWESPSEFDEDEFNDDTIVQHDVAKSKVVNSLISMNHTNTIAKKLEKRHADYDQKPVEQRALAFKKAYGQISKKPLRPPDRLDITDAENMVQIRGRFAPDVWPLGRIRNVKMKDPEVVDYLVDEVDLEFLTDLNARRRRTGKEYLPVPTLEFWMDRLEKKCIFVPRNVQKMQNEDGEDMDDVCNICLDGDAANCNQIVYCEFCEIAVHQDCYGIPFLPEKPFVCRRCLFSPGRAVDCALCPQKSGAFKQWLSGKWVHVICVIWVDETHFGNTIFMEHVQNVEKALYDRRALSCTFCKNRKEAKMGACIQCSEAKCTASFHVTCARNAGLVMRVNEAADGNVSRYVWCLKHTPAETEEDRESREKMIRNAKREAAKGAVPRINMPSITVAQIAEIQAAAPTDEEKEIVLFWFQKRKWRLGAPLTKNHSEPNDPSAGGGLSSRRTSIGADPKNSETIEQLRAIRENLVSAVKGAELILRREDEKNELLAASLRMFERGFKPAEQLCMEVMARLHESDTEKVFEKPVDCPGYTDLIKNPMCLQDMANRLAQGHYKTFQPFHADYQLMMANCMKFNRDNIYYLTYGKKFKKSTLPVVEKARREDQERQALKQDEKLMTLLFPGVMDTYTGWTNKPLAIEGPEEVKKEEGLQEEEAPPTVTGSRRRKRLHSFPPKNVKEEPDEEQPGPSGSGGPSAGPSATPSTSAVTPRRPRSRRLLEQQQQDQPGPSTAPSTSSALFESPSEEPPKWSGTPAAQTLRKRVQQYGTTPPEVGSTTKVTRSTAMSSAAGPSTSGASSSSMRQTQLTSFFSIQGKQQVTFADIAKKGPHGAHRSIFEPTPSTSTPRASRPSTRSSSHFAASSTTTPVVSGRNSFRVSSSALQSPLPVPKKIGARALLSEDDDEEINLVAPPKELTPQQLEAEKLRSAENEAKSKFAHNQLVVVEGRAAKVIEYQLAHLSDILPEQRQSMLKKRREILGVITDQPYIYVEFFQKSNTMENFKWVHPETVELLDLSNVGRSPKIPGLKAAREWHQKVLNGERI